MGKIKVVFDNNNYQDTGPERTVESGIPKNVKLALLIELSYNVLQQGIENNNRQPEVENFLQKMKDELVTSEANYYWDAHEKMDWDNPESPNHNSKTDCFDLYGFTGTAPETTETFMKFLLDNTE